VLLLTSPTANAEASIAAYKQLKKSPAGDFSVDKETLISVGYRFLNTGRVRDAIKILQFEVRKYPEYWNAYNSLGEMYMKAGNNYQAIKNYENSLTLKPDNDGAAVALKALQKHDKRLGPY
jgi:tetratricopeptide (TPR) repeat protein